jgi:hypothetical protein
VSYRQVQGGPKLKWYLKKDAIIYVRQIDVADGWAKLANGRFLPLRTPNGEEVLQHIDDQEDFYNLLKPDDLAEHAELFTNQLETTKATAKSVYNTFEIKFNTIKNQHEAVLRIKTDIKEIFDDGKKKYAKRHDEDNANTQQRDKEQ